MKIHGFFKRPLCGIAILVLSNCSSTKHLAGPAAGHFIATPVVVDGDDKEWPSPYPSYDSKAMISYAMANDRDNLYITVKTGDEKIQRKLVMGGLTVWIDPTGKKDESLAIQYPLKSNGAMPDGEEGAGRGRRKEGERPPMRDSSERRKHEMPIPNDVSFVGFTDCSGGTTINKSNSCGIKVRMGRNDYGELVWEAAVPLKTLYGTAPATSPATPISIGFEIGGMAMPARSGEGGGRGGNGGGGMGGGGGMSGGGGVGGGMMGGGGMGGGMGGHGGGGHGGGGGQGGRGGGEDDNSNLSQTTKTWTKTGLVFP